MSVGWTREEMAARAAQDIFLLGPPGPARRRLAASFCELLGRECEWVTVHRDTTEADLKVRREIRGNGSQFSDGPVVRAALRGRVLIIEGIERAERNVLSLLNNLLENREMSLEDGRFLTSPERYDELRVRRARVPMLRRMAPS